MHSLASSLCGVNQCFDGLLSNSSNEQFSFFITWCHNQCFVVCIPCSLFISSYKVRDFLYSQGSLHQGYDHFSDKSRRHEFFMILSGIIFVITSSYIFVTRQYTGQFLAYMSSTPITAFPLPALNFTLKFLVYWVKRKNSHQLRVFYDLWNNFSSCDVISANWSKFIKLCHSYSK